MNVYRVAAIMCILAVPPVVYPQAVLEADGPGNTYELINRAFAPGNAAVENPECVHPAFGRHIAEVWDSTLNQYVFEFYSHVVPDNDRCIYLDRQRIEIKTYEPSPDSLKGVTGETITYKWKFRLPAGFQPSTSFTHIHQIKAVGGNEGDPIFTLTPRKGSPNKLELIHDNTTKVRTADLSLFDGVWVECTEVIRVGSNGTYSMTIRRVSDRTILLEYSNGNIMTIRSDNTFIRPKWGIYRSLDHPSDLRDEAVRFAGFSIQEMRVTRSYEVAASWNLISVPLRVNDFRASTLYANATSQAFSYHNGYEPVDTLEQGRGYWVRFPALQYVSMTGNLGTADTISVEPGWNMVGAISAALPVRQITSIPPGLTVSPFYGFDSGYVEAESLEPHKGYWVKVEQDGKLLLSTEGSSGGAVQIVKTGELPPDPPSTAGVEQERNPSRYRLDQNYPNPFNPTTTVRFTIGGVVPPSASEGPAAAHVRLSVYDMLGREVAVLVDGRVEAGVHDVAFDARGLSGGMYFYRMIAGDHVDSRSMLLIR